ncbi:MAG: hypothetical protein Q7V20_04830 [Aquabacterium sp.]|uniref:hypothetical protein n=1 Tax=Aquabacterium sp. TaxID=1872578 RepID=UPI0027185BCE|nr:hypothetical protein [Aquabacterium sp.]MDO9002763.1 hypothetical protein [Aquabacterium sp.]
MKFIGKFGEYLTLTRLLENEVEAYPAIKINQDSYDLTAISKSGRILRIQVKATELQNKSTNNNIGSLAREFDFLVVVVVHGEREADCYVLTHAEAHAIRGTSKLLGISRLEKRASVVKAELAQHKEQWRRIRDA